MWSNVRVDRIGQPEAGRAGLPGAQYIAAAAQPKILVGDQEAVVGVAQQGQPAAGGFVDPVLVQQQAETGVGAASDPAAQLVQLRQAEAFGVLDDHDAGLGHVDADLHHGGGHQQADRAGGEGGQGGVAHLRRLLAMGQADPVAEAALQIGEAFLGGGEVQSASLSATSGQTQ